LQIPKNVIDAGYPSNNRVSSMRNQSGGMKSVPIPLTTEPKSNDGTNIE